MAPIQNGTFYDYICEEEQSEFYYQFVTEKELIYTIVISPSLFTDVFIGCPTLMESGWAIAFSCIPFSTEANDFSYDPKVSNTIKEVIKDFLSENKGAVLVYNCDGSDKHQAGTQVLYTRWAQNETEYVHYPYMYKQRLADGTNKDHYLGYFLLNIEKLKNIVAEESISFMDKLVARINQV